MRLVLLMAAVAVASAVPLAATPSVEACHPILYRHTGPADLHYDHQCFSPVSYMQVCVHTAALDTCSPWLPTAPLPLPSHIPLPPG